MRVDLLLRPLRDVFSGLGTGFSTRTCVPGSFKETPRCFGNRLPGRPDWIPIGENQGPPSFGPHVRVETGLMWHQEPFRSGRDPESRSPQGPGWGLRLNRPGLSPTLTPPHSDWTWELDLPLELVLTLKIRGHRPGDTVTLATLSESPAPGRPVGSLRHNGACHETSGLPVWRPVCTNGVSTGFLLQVAATSRVLLDVMT